MKKKRRRSSRTRRWIILIAAAVLLIVILKTGIGSIRNRNSADESSDRGGSAPAESVSSGTDTSSEAAAASAFMGSTAAYALSQEEAGAPGESPDTSKETGTAGESPDAAKEAGASGESPEAEKQAGASGESSEAEKQAGASGESPGASEEAGHAVSSTAAASRTGEEAPAYDHTVTELEEGRQYLRMLEERTPMDTGQQIVDARKEYQLKKALMEYAKKRDSYREELEENGVREAFSDYVFLGDSRVVGFSIYGYLAPDRVLAESGDTITAITDKLDSIKSYAPKYIFLSFGINDIGVGLWPTAEEYADAYEEEIDALREALPEAEIYVNSILPATQRAAEGTPIWEGLPEYSEAVRQMCARKEISFIDNDALVEEHEQLYEQDGVHFQPDFYYYWAENQLLGIFDRENGYLTFRDPSLE